MENKTVESKKVAIDFKALAESVENAFGKQDAVDVIADTNLPKGPKYTTLAEYRMVHFFKPGTDKDMFQLIVNSKGARFIVRNNAAELLDDSVTKNPVLKKVKGEPKTIHHEVICDMESITATAEKIIAAYQSIPAKEPKPKKKAEKAVSTQTEKKPAAPKKAKKTAPKKAAATA